MNNIPAPAHSEALVVWFKHLSWDSVAVAGGKGASLGRMVSAGMPVPPGFVVCAGAFRRFLEEHGGHEVLASLVGLDVQDSATLETASGAIRHWIRSHSIPSALESAIRDAYNRLANRDQDCLVAVRSSAISEDSETASFAGQQETFLNVRGADSVVKYVRECWLSFFSPRAIFYRAQKGALTDAGMAVVVQQMVQAEKSGVMFTVDPIQKRHDRLVIEAVYGLGEGIVSGLITPDHYLLDRDDGSLVNEFIATQSVAVVFDQSSGRTEEVELSEPKGSSRVLNEIELKEILEMGLRLESFFGKPQDVEWCIDQSKLFLLQSRPITTL